MLDKIIFNRKIIREKTLLSKRTNKTDTREVFEIGGRNYGNRKLKRHLQK